jgi:von Willebrand factor type A domain
MDIVKIAFLSVAVLGLAILAYVLGDLFQIGPIIKRAAGHFAFMLGSVAAGLRRRAQIRNARRIAQRGSAEVSPLLHTASHLPPSSTPVTTDAAPQLEIRGQIAALEAADRSVARRNRLLAVALTAGLCSLGLVLWGVYQYAIGSYAELENVAITRHPANQGLLQISFQVRSPGRVLYERSSGRIETEVIDVFHKRDDYRRSWSWIYEPGQDVVVSLRSRAGLWRATRREAFPTSRSADIVILMDTTGSMSRSIAQLQEKCMSFSAQLKQQALAHRFALVGFGDANEAQWIDSYPFRTDVEQFRRDVQNIKRFDGGDLPESALDALEQALELPFEAGAIRRFYLVTDAQFHEPARSGARASDLAARLEKENVLLSVFSRSEYAADYAKLLGPSGKFQEIESFGAVLSEGRALED